MGKPPKSDSPLQRAKRFTARSLFRIRTTTKSLVFGSEPVATQGRHAPRMLRFSIALLMSLTAAIALAASTFLLLARLRGAVDSLWPLRLSSKRLTSNDIYELTRSTIAAAGLAAGVFAAVYAYRKQRVEEAASRRADSEHLSSRYQNAADQLGNDKAAVRLAGVYALARLADEWVEERQTCIDVLCAYYRMHSEDEEIPTGEREVRETILSSIMTHLENSGTDSWQGYAFNLQRALFDSDIYLLRGLREGTFFDVTGATFSDGTLIVSQPLDEDFGTFVAERALFKGSTKVEFSGWYREGVIDFGGAELNGGRFDFTRLRIDGADLNFQGALLSGASVYFSGAHFTDGDVRFDRAAFRAGSVDFNHAEFSKGVTSFRYASYESASLTFEDTEGEQPIGLPASFWQPRQPEGD